MDNERHPLGQQHDESGLDAGSLLRSAIERRRESVMDSFGLTSREREVVTEILNGETRASAAKKLFISERTVKFHIENCYKKMHVGGKNELIQLFYAESFRAD